MIWNMRFGGRIFAAPVRLHPGLAAGLLWFCVAGGLAADTPEGFPFPVGESLKYRIVWGVVPVGHSEAVTEWTEVDGRRLIAIRIRARSNDVIRMIYPVTSFIETLVDPDTRMPVRFTKNSREGRHRTHEVTEFDYAAGVARQHNVRKDRHTEFAIEAGTRDLLSFMYFIRGAPFSVGERTEHRVMADEKIYDLEIRAVKEERIETGDSGKARAVLLDPKAAFDGLFVRKGSMRLWVTQAAPLMILRAEVEVPVARVKLILEP